MAYTQIKRVKNAVGCADDEHIDDKTDQERKEGKGCKCVGNSCVDDCDTHK